MSSSPLVIFPGVRQSFGQLQYVRTTNLLAVADASLYSNFPDAPFGSLPFVAAGAYAGETNRGLFRFDLSGIPTNAMVTNVTVSLVAYSQPPSGVLFGLSLVLTNWDEYAVTWNSRSSLMPWTAPGGQRRFRLLFIPFGICRSVGGRRINESVHGQRQQPVLRPSP